MWRFCNDDRRLLRKNIRVAQSISLEEFNKKITEFSENFYDVFGNLNPKMKQLDKDLDEITVSSTTESSFSGFFFTHHDIPVYITDWMNIENVGFVMDMIKTKTYRLAQYLRRSPKMRVRFLNTRSSTIIPSHFPVR